MYKENSYLTSYGSTVARLYYLMIHADGDLTAGELNVGRHIMSIEGLKESIMDTELVVFNALPRAQVIESCVNNLRAIGKPLLTRAIAWMYVVSEIDWVTDKNETSLIEEVCSQLEDISISEVALVESELSKQLVNFQKRTG
jgi:hypothetical protein